MPESIELLAPAKVNLNLTVKGRRKDGFHDIESLMVPISIFDRLRISHVEKGELQFTCSDESLPTGDENLVVRAARLFCESTGMEPRLKIALTKEIPHGAGLGGGSSDAASTLLGLNRLFETELSREALAKMAAELGSDIPFFIYQSAAVIRGRGETVSPQPFRHSLSLLLIRAECGLRPRREGGSGVRHRTLVLSLPDDRTGRAFREGAGGLDARAVQQILQHLRRFEVLLCDFVRGLGVGGVIRVDLLHGFDDLVHGLECEQSF